jgi:hypothetical protein
MGARITGARIEAPIFGLISLALFYTVDTAVRLG